MRPIRAPGTAGSTGAFPILLLIVHLVVACGTAMDDQVAEVASGTASEETHLALLLAKDRAVGPLLSALEADPSPDGRAGIVRVLVGLMMRTDDPRITAMLRQLLSADPDSTIRADVARHLGLQRRRAMVADLTDALDDPSGIVREQALIALSQLKRHWTEHADEIDLRIRALARDSHLGTRVEAMVLQSVWVHERVQAARRATLGGDLARAESLLVATLDDVPGDRRAGYALGRHYYDNGQETRGLDVLRRYGMLLDLPLLAHPPVIDGRVDEEVWLSAARIDSFWQLSRHHEAALPTRLRTELRVGYRPEGIYLAAVCWDDEPQNIVIEQDADSDRTGRGYHEDRIEFYMDPDFDHVDMVQIAVNPQGMRQDLAFPAPREYDFEWDAHGEWAASIGDDRWELELFIEFRGEHMSPPIPGQVWGANFIRVYRGKEFVQWTRTSGNAVQPDQLGVLLFRP